MSETAVDDAAVDEVWRRSILPVYFPDVPAASEPPTLILLAGQVGAGRSRASWPLLVEHADLTFINGDDLRAFHPGFRELVSSRDSAAQEELARAAAGWVRDSVRYARENRRSVVLEGAFPDASVAVGTAERFAGAGFQTRVIVVASRRAESLLSVTSLYLRDVQARSPARPVSRDAHDRGFEATRALVAAVEDAASVDRLTVLGRGGGTVFDAHRADGFIGAGEALVAAQSEQLSRFDATQWLSELHHVTEFATSRGSLPGGVTELLVDLHETALREVIPELHIPADGKFATAIEQKAVAGLVALRRLQQDASVDAAAPVVAPTGPERGGVSR